MPTSPLIRSVVLCISFCCTLGAVSDDVKPKHHPGHTEIATAARGEQMMMRRDQHEGSLHHEHQHHHHHEASEKHTHEANEQLSQTSKAREVRKHVDQMVHELLDGHKYQHKAPDSELEVEGHPQHDENTDTTTKAPLVSCGGHTATRCRLCTVIDPETGLETVDRGPDWCHGDCTYYEGECHTLTSYNLHVERDQSEEGASTTRLIPDLLNPNITAEDKDIMDAAADRSIQEADYEAKMRMAAEKKKEEERKNKENNFIYAAITTGAGVLSCCACLSCICLLKWCCSSDGGKELTVAEDAGLLAETEG